MKSVPISATTSGTYGTYGTYAFEGGGGVVMSSADRRNSTSNRQLSTMLLVRVLLSVIVLPFFVRVPGSHLRTFGKRTDRDYTNV